MLRYSVRFALATLLWALAAGPAVGEPRVVASIPPVHALVAGVMAGVGEPELLMRGGGSPHAYSLRPSQALALREAEVVFWVGEALETFLEKPLQSLAGGARVVELLEAPGVQLLPVRAGGAWEGEGHHGGEQTAGAGPGAEGHDHGGVNPHVWLDPANASALVTAIATALSRADPAHRAAYAANAGRLRSALADLDAELRARLAPVRARPFVVFHDAYAYLEQAYGLRGVGALTVDPEQPPGARRLRELRAAIRGLGAVCVFAEPQFRPRLVQTLIEGSAARTGVLDPLGTALPPGPGLYFTLMRNLAAGLVRCLGPGP